MSSHKPAHRSAGIHSHRVPTCPSTGKRRYRDRRQAQDALEGLKWAGALAGQWGQETQRRECRAYRCPDCKGWHTTSLVKWASVDRTAAA